MGTITLEAVAAAPRFPPVAALTYVAPENLVMVTLVGGIAAAIRRRNLNPLADDSSTRPGHAESRTRCEA